MKKKLVASLAAAMVLSVAGTSFAAANPFSDVPAKSWAYDAVMNLTQAGIVDGYGDGTFKGDKLMTRYEMAQIVAKAMAHTDRADAMQKAEINRLAVEFSEELNTLGVRVSALEKKVGNVKFSGDARVRFVRNDKTQGGTFYDRFRLNMDANINDNTSFYGRIMIPHTAEGANNNLVLSDAAMTTKDVFNSGATATIGRFSQALDPVGYYLGTTGLVDGAKIIAGNKFKVTVGMADFSQATGIVTGTQTPGIQTAVFATADYNISNATKLSAAYLADKSNTDPNQQKTWIAGGSAKISPDVVLTGEYMKNSAVANDPKGYLARISYKAANAKVQGSWGSFVEYYKFDNGMLPCGTVTATGAKAAVSDFQTWNIVNLQNNQKAYDLVVNYTLAKNIVLDAVQTFETKNATTGATGTNYTRFNVNYMF
jgi:hypothetical protein